MRLPFLDTKQAFDACLLERKGQLVVVEFTAEWCGPCKKMAPFLEALAEQHRDVHFCKCDVDKNEETASELRITSMPTFHFYCDGQKLAEHAGADEETLHRLLAQHRTATRAEAGMVRKEAARSVADLPLPPVPPEAVDKTSLVLFYQYVEPQWTDKEHREALKYVLALGERCNVKGRGRCAAEGLNCTLTGPPEAIRAFCEGLRAWKPTLFGPTDFKITDGLAHEHGFKALTIQKRDDLVAYGLPSEIAPALKTSKARHVEADEYHALMNNPDSVIIDVRNAYESAIGHFAPPSGGATLIDPKLRNSVCERVAPDARDPCPPAACLGHRARSIHRCSALGRSSSQNG